MLRVKVLSDIHLEYFDTYPGIDTFVHTTGGDIDVICLCGDIGDPASSEYKQFLLECADRCNLRTFVVMGNHEAYHKLVSETERMIARICELHDKLTFLNRSAYDMNGYRFIGTTLWTNIASRDTPFMRQHIGDFRYIARWSVSDCTRMFQENVAWIGKEVERAEQDEKSLIVLTHHVPVMCVGNPKHHGELLKTAFASDLQAFIESTQGRIAYWFHGHDHYSQGRLIGKTWIASNQYGKEKEDTGFQEDWICEI